MYKKWPLVTVGLVVALLLNAATPLFADDTGGTKRQDAINVDFRDMEIKTLVQFISKLYDLIPVVSEEVKGKITLISPKPLSKEETYRVVMAVLESKGYTLLKSEQMLKVIKKREAVQKAVETYYGADAALIPFEDRVISQIVPIEYGDSQEILSNIRPLVSSSGNLFVSKNTGALVITDVATNIKRLLKIINHLDVPQSTSEMETNVYPVRYIKAKEIADALTSVFADEKKDGANLKITPMESTNTLIVTGDRKLHPNLATILDQLDVRRQQVLIEVRIVEATFTDQLSFGINLTEYLFSHGDKSFRVNMGSALADAFVSFSITSDKLKGALEMLAKEAAVNVLSSPRILTSDNQEARITVGQEQPILKSVTDLGTEGSAGKTVSDFVYKDVGLELEVTPRINVDRDVALEVAFKITDILEEVEFPGGVTAPLMGKREASTSVTIMDGNVLVIGGLMKNNNRDERQKVPVLGDIPLLGLLFSKVSKKIEQTELLLFIRPRVVANEEEGMALTRNETDLAESDHFKSLSDQASPIEELEREL